MNQPVVIDNDRDMNGQVQLTHVVYFLMSIGVIFSVGLSAVIAVVINYVKLDDVRGSWLESHFRWQIRTFWFALLWLAVGGLAFITLIGIPLAWLVWSVSGIWVVYRIVKGWLRLSERRPIEF
jgi:uncharacterized membrane protein